MKTFILNYFLNKPSENIHSNKIRKTEKKKKLKIKTTTTRKQKENPRKLLS